MGTVNELLAIARKQIGTCESPPDSNNVRYNTWYWGREVSGQQYPWCMAFVQWVFDQAKAPLPRRTASCGDLMRAAQAAGCWVVRDFQPGDVVIYDFSGKKKSTEHCGIVEMELPDYGMQAVEGNTSQSGSQSNGGMVCRKNRPSKYIIGAVRPQLEQEEKEDIMTGKEIYDALQDYLKTQSVPKDTQKEVDEALELDITDGKNLMQLPNRYQILLMIKRAMEK